MTVQQQARYATSSDRNLANFIARNGCKLSPMSNLLPLDHAFYAGMELTDLKHHIGVRQRDLGNDEALKTWLDKVKAHAKKTGIAAKEVKRNKKAPTTVAELQDGQAVDELKAAAIKIVKVTEKVYFAESEDQRGKKAVDLQPEPEALAKKVNPKKAARQAALEKSGTAPKKNADQARAEFSAANAKRQPRLMTKH